MLILSNSLCAPSAEPIETNDLFNTARNKTSVISVPSSTIPDRVVDDLRALGEMTDGWDSHGAKRIDRNTLHASGYLIWHMYRAADALGMALPEPRVTAGSDGSVGLYWFQESTGADLEVFISGGGLDITASRAGEVRSIALTEPSPLDVLAWIHRELGADTA